MAAPVPQQPGGQYQPTVAVQQPGGQQQLQQQTPIIVQQTAGQHQPIVVHQHGDQNQPIVLPPEICQQNVSNAQNAPSTPSRGNSLARQVTGCLQLLAAVVSVASTSFAVELGTTFTVVWGIWSGIFFYGPAGILGIASKGRGRCLITAYLVFSILSSISAMGQLFYDSIAASLGFRDNFIYTCNARNDIVCKVLYVISAVTALCEMFIAIVASCLCCCGGLFTCTCTCDVRKIQQPSGQTEFGMKIDGSLENNLQLPQTPPNGEDHVYEPPPPPEQSTYAEAYQEFTLTPPHLNQPLPHPSSPADTPTVFETGISPDLVPAYESNTTPTLDHTYMIPIETPTIEHTYMSKQ